MTQQIIQFIANPQHAEAWPSQAWSALIQQGYANGSLARIAALTRRAGVQERVPTNLRWHLDAADTYYQSHRHGVLQEIAALQQALAFSGIRPVFLKGAAYVIADLQLAEGRVFTDIDAAVTRSLLTKAEQCLHWHGWTNIEKDDYDQHYYRAWMHELPPFVNQGSGSVLDLHHTLVPPISGHAPDISLFPTQEVHIDGMCLTTFTPAGMLLHSAVHLFYEEDFSKGFRDLSDIHLLCNEFASDDTVWRELTELVNRVGFGREVALALRYCQRQFNTALPDTMLDWLARHLPGNWLLAGLDPLFTELLKPVDMQNNKSVFATTLGLVRGHWKKMPLHILLYHIWHKARVAWAKRTAQR